MILNFFLDVPYSSKHVLFLTFYFLWNTKKYFENIFVHTMKVNRVQNKMK